MIEFEEESDSQVCIKVIGVGGAGGMVVDKIGDWGRGIEILSINTDVMALKQLRLKGRVRIGAKLTKGLGTGGNPDIARKAFQKEKDRVAAMLAGVDLVFIVAGLGGGMGTGASPCIGELASELGAISVGVVTMPFTFEGAKKADLADVGSKELRRVCDTLICIPNERLFGQGKRDSSLLDAFDEANLMLLEALRAFCSLLRPQGLVGLDFAEVRELLRKSGDACFGVGIGAGQERGRMACESALDSPLLEDGSFSTGNKIILSITGGENLRREEIEEISRTLSQRIGQNLDTVLGISVDRLLKSKLRVTVVVTGLSPHAEKKASMVREESLSHFITGQGAYPGHLEDELDIPAFLRKRRRKKSGEE